MGGCVSHVRGARTAPARKHPNVEFEQTLGRSFRRNCLRISLPNYIESCAGHFTNTTPKLTSMNKSTDLHFSPHSHKKPLLTSVNKSTDFHFSPHSHKKPLSTPCSCQSSPGDRKWKTSLKIEAEDLSTERRDGNVTNTVDDDSTSLADSREECPSTGEMESEPSPVKQQPQNLVFEITNLPPEILDQLRNLEHTDNPEAKAVAEQFCVLITKLLSSENCKQRQVANMMSRSLDLNICAKGNNVNVNSALMGDPDDCNWSKSSLGSVAQCDPLKLSEGDIGKSEQIMSGTDHVSGETIASLKDDEKVNSGMEEFQRQVIRSRRKSFAMSEALTNLPPLSQSLARSRIASLSLKVSSFNNGSVMSVEEDAVLETTTSKIDELDKKISKITLTVTALQRRSSALLTEGSDSGDSDYGGKNLSFLNVEKEINRWQDHKNKLVDERDMIVTELQSKLIDQITSAPLIDPFARESMMVTEQLPYGRIKSLSVIDSFSTVGNLGLPEENTEAEEIE